MREKEGVLLGPLDAVHRVQIGEHGSDGRPLRQRYLEVDAECRHAAVDVDVGDVGGVVRSTLVRLDSIPGRSATVVRIACVIPLSLARLRPGWQA
jgi:hypothetical protein